jgi:hypothetical protein
VQKHFVEKYRNMLRLFSISIGTVPMTMSLIASFMSSATIMGVPADPWDSALDHVPVVRP